MAKRIQNAVTTISCISLLLLVVLSFAAIGIKLKGPQLFNQMAGYELAYEEVVVEPGDTLWSIAKAKMPNEDPRNVIERMLEMNELRTTQIYPGMKLQVETIQSKDSVQYVKK